MKMFLKPGVELTAVSASGTKIVTKEYGVLTDFEAGCWANVLGHGREEILKVIQEDGPMLFHTHQFFKTPHPHELIQEISKGAKLPDEYDGTFISSGSEAVSLAVMLAELLTGRKKMLSFSISYLSAAPGLRIPRNQEVWTDLDVMECINCEKCKKTGEGCKGCPKVKDLDFSQYGAFVFEPGNSGGLILCPPLELIEYLAEGVKAAGGFLIANEVTTGFGRTGRWFGFQHYAPLNKTEYSPDFITMGKGLGNGYPISGVLVKADLAKKVEDSGFRYVQSHIDDPLGCMVSKKVVDLMIKERAVEEGADTGAYLREKLEGIKVRTGVISEIRGRGMMNGIVLAEGWNSKDVFEELLKRGFFVGFIEGARLLRFYPPLIITKKEIDDLCYHLELILKKNPVKKTLGTTPVEKVQRLLKNTYWAKGRSKERIQTSLDHSICYEIYDSIDAEKMIGFARVVTDYASTYWLCDVVVDEAYRGLGLGKKLVEAVCMDPDIRGMRGRLATKDAFGLYEKYGFLREPERSMTKEAE